MNTFCENSPIDKLYEIDYVGHAATANADAIVQRADMLPVSAIRELVGRLVTSDDSVILDLTPGSAKHIPDGLRTERLIGVGPKRSDPVHCPGVDEYVVHDLNGDPALPFTNAMFHSVICASYISFWNDPVGVFTQVARVLKPGGVFVVIFSNCYVKLWRQSLGEGRLKRVRDTFYESESFERPRVLTLEPDSDSVAHKDAVFAVYAERASGDEKSRAGPQPRKVYPYNAQEIADRKAQVKDTLRCPYCDHKLKQYWVTQTPFTEWPSEYQYVCLNDECVYFVEGWHTLAEQEVPGSYRFMFEPTVGGCYSIPVLSRHDLKNRTTD
jgi:SAM-dependent methyltransferase